MRRAVLLFRPATQTLLPWVLKGLVSLNADLTGMVNNAS
jgi:hypothetical protein